MKRTKPFYVKPVIPDWIPDELSGRYISNRGVHFLPFSHHYVWMRLSHDGIDKPTRQYWVSELKRMGLSWVILINDGDSVIQKFSGKEPIRVLMEAGVYPIIRAQMTFPGHFEDLETVKRTVSIYAEFGLRAPWIIGNEPLDPREWKNGDVPPYDEAMAIVVDRWKEAANAIIAMGGVIGFPDGPCYSKNPLLMLTEYRDAFRYGDAFYAGHFYGKGRPENYPYDDVSQTGYEYYDEQEGIGYPLSEEMYDWYLDDYAHDPQWREESITLINQRRFELVDATKTGAEDCTCFRGWERIVNWSRETFGFDIPMALTEGGWVPRDRAGSGPNTDIRWPHTTPNMVGRRTVRMYEMNSPFFAICPWLIADDAMQIHGYVGWPYDSWYGWAYTDKYPYNKPVTDALAETRPMPIRVWANEQCGNTKHV